MSELGRLFDELRQRGYEVVGPTARDGAIVLDELASAEALPAGWGEEQSPGRYRLVRRDDEARFGHTVGPHSFRRFFHPPEETLVQLRRKEASFEVIPTATGARKLALLGARDCDIAGLSVHDEVLMNGPTPDDRYAARREDVLVIAVACHDPAATCFCTSMGGGPRPRQGFDLSLSELLDGDHRFVVEVGSDAGRELVDALGLADAEEVDRQAANDAATKAAKGITKKLDTDGIQELLDAALEHPRFEEVAERCLTCANCTLVCPTCFCTRVDDVTSLDGETAERVRRWDSCFSLDHSYMHGGPARSSTAARYRQWLTHKLSSWISQFGSSGCVGCGRCITWCPSGIDITEEVAAIRAVPAPPPSKRI